MGYSAQGAEHDHVPSLSVRVWIFDAETGVEYDVSGWGRSLRRGNPDATIAIVRSLLPADGAPPAPKRYDRLDATGAVATAGSWAILGADASVLTTWEDLRGSAAALRVHRNDASGASRAAAWGAVEAGDLVEWRKADDCWVRYLVAGAPAPPASGSSLWEFPVERMTYAATRRRLHPRRRGEHRLQRRRGRPVRRPGVRDRVARAPRAVPGLPLRLDGRAGAAGVLRPAGSRRGRRRRGGRGGRRRHGDAPSSGLRGGSRGGEAALPVLARPRAARRLGVHGSGRGRARRPALRALRGVPQRRGPLRSRDLRVPQVAPSQPPDRAAGRRRGGLRAPASSTGARRS